MIDQNNQNNNNNNNNEGKISLFDEEKSIIDESFSVDFADAYEKEINFGNKDVNETILEQKMKQMNNSILNPNDVSMSFLNDFEIMSKKDFSPQNFQNMPNMQNNNNFQNMNNIQNIKNQNFLEVRILPKFTEKEYIKIKKNVSGNLLTIQNYLLNLRMNYIQFDPNKKIGPLLPLTYCIENHYIFKPDKKIEMQNKYEKLKNYIFNFRTIFGDGNCFYRAVMFRYIELLILYNEINTLKALTIDINKSFQSSEIKKRLKIGRDYLNPQLIIQVMVTIIELMESKRIPDAHMALYKSFLFSKIFDYSIILYFRYILYIYIKQNEKKLYTESFPVLIGNLLAVNYEKNGKFNFSNFFDNNLLKMFSYAEKIVICMTPFVLGVNLHLISFELNQKDVVQKFGYTGTSDIKFRDVIFILNRNNHFENIFTLEDNNKFEPIYRIYRNNFPPTFININYSLNRNNNQNNNQNKNQNNQKINNSQSNQNQNNMQNNQFLQNNMNNQNNNNSLQGKNVIIPQNQNMKNMIFGNQNLRNNNNINNSSNNFNNKNLQQQNQSNILSSNNQIQNSQYRNLQAQQVNINKVDENKNNNNNSNNNENPSLKTHIYFFQQKENILKYNNLFNQSQNIYSLAQIYKDVNSNINMNNNSNNNNSIYNNNKQNNININSNNNINNNIYNNNNSNNINNNIYKNNKQNDMNINSNFNPYDNINLSIDYNNISDNKDNNSNIKNNKNNDLKNSIKNNLNNYMNNNSSLSNNSNSIINNSININQKNNNLNNTNNNLSNINNNKDINKSESFSLFDMNEMKKEISGFGPFKCNKCSLSHTGLKTIKNICPKCFIIEIIEQSKKKYIDYLRNVTSLNKKDEFNNLFLDKICINYDNKKLNINEAIDELNTKENVKGFNAQQTLNDIIYELKQRICLYCFCDIYSTEFKIPCGCNFCGYNHLELFIKEKIHDKLTINYKCFCSYEYKPNKLLELCNFFKNKNIYKNYYDFIERLNELFSGICFKCGCENSNLSPVDIQGFCPINFKHYICEDCIQKDSYNYVKCSICCIQHKYLLIDFY